VVCYKGEPVQTVISSVALDNQVLASLAGSLDPRWRTYLFGSLSTHESVEIAGGTIPFSPISGSSHMLKLNHATFDDIGRHHLENVLIARGQLTLRSTVAIGIDSLSGDLSQDSSSGYVTYTLRHSLGESIQVHAARGDTIDRGQVLAETQNLSLHMLRSDLDKEKHAITMDRYRSELTSLRLQIAKAIEKIRADSLEGVRLRELSEAGFATMDVLVGIREKLNESKTKLEVLNGRMQLLLRGIEASASDYALDTLARGRTMRKRHVAQSVRSEVAGLVVDVRRSLKGDKAGITFILRRIQ
jgi:hypothetical protein